MVCPAPPVLASSSPDGPEIVSCQVAEVENRAWIGKVSCRPSPLGEKALGALMLVRAMPPLVRSTFESSEGEGVGEAVGVGFGVGVALGVGFGVGVGVGFGVGVGVDFGVGVGAGEPIAALAVGFADGADDRGGGVGNGVPMVALGVGVA